VSTLPDNPPLAAEGSPRLRWREYLELTKPKVTLLIVFTAIVGMVLASPGMVPLPALIFGTLGIALASGSAAVGDYERLNDPALNADLATLAGATTVSAQATALVPLEQYIAANLPIIPVTTAPEWFEYNSQNYTGWPTQQNPYDSGQPSGTNNGPGSGTDEVVILHLHPR